MHSFPTVCFPIEYFFKDNSLVNILVEQSKKTGKNLHSQIIMIIRNSENVDNNECCLDGCRRPRLHFLNPDIKKALMDVSGTTAFLEYV